LRKGLRGQQDQHGRDQCNFAHQVTPFNRDPQMTPELG
jgi:hypothetical protein